MTTSPEPTDSEAQLPDEQSPEAPEQNTTAQEQAAAPEQAADPEQAATPEQEPAAEQAADPEQAAAPEQEPAAEQAPAPEQAAAPVEPGGADETPAEPAPVSAAQAPPAPAAEAPDTGASTGTPADQDTSADASPAPEQPTQEQPAQEQSAQEQSAEVLAGDELTGLPPAPSEGGAASDTASEDAPAAEQAAEAPSPDASAPAEGTGGKKRKRGKKGKGGGDEGAGDKAGEKPAQQAPKKKGNHPEPAEIIRRIGTTNEQALAYVANPDPKLSRLSKKVQEALLPELPPVTAGALLGPAALARHLVASAAAGRYRDLFTLWELFRQHPAECKPVLAERSIALEKGQRAMRTSVILGLRGNATRVAEDVRLAQGLIWQWLREVVVEALPAIGARPAVASALLEREPDLDVPLPANPNERWLTEAAEARQAGPLAPRIEQVLAEHVHRLPATVETLRLATLHYPARVEALVDRVDLDAPEIGAFLAWARDHGAAERLHGRIRERVGGTAARDRAEGLALWYSWQQRGVRLELPESLRTDSLEGFDLSKPETAELAARLRARGVDVDLQGQLDALAGQNRQLAEKAYEAMVCANLDVHLPEALKDNPTVNEGTRCPNCQAWTWVRPGHEQRCPRPPAPAAEPEPDPFELAAAEVSGPDTQ